MDFLGLQVGDLDQIGMVTVLVLVAVAVITDKLVWHTRLKNAEARADRWEQIALDALTAGAVAGVRAAEVAADVVSALPDPTLDDPSKG
jgi:hypothetical protein